MLGGVGRTREKLALTRLGFGYQNVFDFRVLITAFLHVDVNRLVTVRAKKSEVRKTDNIARGVGGYWDLVMSLDIFDSVPDEKIFATYIA